MKILYYTRIYYSMLIAALQRELCKVCKAHKSIHNSTRTVHQVLTVKSDGDAEIGRLGEREENTQIQDHYTIHSISV